MKIICNYNFYRTSLESIPRCKDISSNLKAKFPLIADEIIMSKKKTPHDFKFIKLLGEGSFSSVYLAVDANLTSASILSNNNNINNNNNGQVAKDQNDSNTVALEDRVIEVKTSSSSTTTTTTTASNNSDSPPAVGDNNKSPTQIIASSRSVNVCSKLKIPKYAIKVCQKSYIKRQGKQAAIMREKDIMNVLNQHPNKHFIKLHYTFQDLDRLYFVMTFAENGELLAYMQENPLNLKLVRKYTLQLLSALEHLHKLNIVHRDLKPENILLNSELNILITDFGSAQIYPDNSFDNNDTTNGQLLSASPDRRNSFVGTAQYVSPEMLKNRQASNKSDLWAFGVIIYQMLTNTMPFNAPNEYLIYQKIQNLDYNYPEDFDPNARDLVNSIIKLEPSERLGSKDDLKNDGYISIRNHSFLTMNLNENECDDSNSTFEKLNSYNLDLAMIDQIQPGLDESQLLRLLTVG